MIGRGDIERLAELARIRMSEDELESMRKDIDSILGYVGQIGEVAASEPSEDSRLGAVRNVMREDEAPHQPELYTEKILAAAPASDGRHVKVKKILGGGDNA